MSVCISGWTVTCDGEKCGERVTAEGLRLASQARQEVIDEGWAHRKGKDYCPTCVEEMRDGKRVEAPMDLSKMVKRRKK